MEKYKYRHELKFKISNSAAEVLKQKLTLILGKDKNAYFEDGSYLIKSLYFDDIESTSYYEKMDGVLRFLFPHIPENHPSKRYIAGNFAANILGLGWASTPTGLSAMEALQQLEEERRRTKHPLALEKGVASREMCTFLVINVSSLQLIPMTIIAYRSQFGAQMPTAIVLPAIIATSISTLVGLIFVKWMGRRP